MHLHDMLSHCATVIGQCLSAVGMIGFAVLMSAVAVAALGPVLSSDTGPRDWRRWSNNRLAVAPVRAAAIARYQAAEAALGRERTPSEALWSLSACAINRKAAEMENLKASGTGHWASVKDGDGLGVVG